MTIDEAIEHTEERACGNDQCAKDHAQLADWLRELRRARMEIDLLKTLRDGFKADAQKYKAENAKLRNAMYTKAGKHALQHMDEDELRIWATQQAEHIEELRDLVGQYHSAMRCTLETRTWTTDPAYLEERMRELGIEVPHD